MNIIYVVRHCKAEGQAPDARLTETGFQQAEQLAEFLSGKSIDYIISSPYIRAYRTIAPLADQLGININLDDRLTERVLAGSNHPEWREMLRHTYDDLDLCYEGGESSSTAMNRAVSVVMEILNSKYTNAVIVSHGNLISLLLKHFDPRIGFNEWEALSNPDVYQLSFTDLFTSTPNMNRIWSP